MTPDTDMPEQRDLYEAVEALMARPAAERSGGPMSEEDRARALELIERAAAGEGCKDVALVFRYLRIVNQGLADVIGALQVERSGGPTFPVAEEMGPDV